MPFIKREFIDSLPDKVDIIATIGKRITLVKKGRDYKACCPFHQEKTPSFSVSSEKQFYHCFGCGEGGGALNFIKKFDNLDFIDAVERLAEENNIAIEYDKESLSIDKSIDEFKTLNQKVSDFYSRQLRTSPAKQKVIDYAKKRGISGEIAKRFEIGFAPPGWDNLYQHFKGSDADIANLFKLGLIVEKNNSSQYYDRFRDRLMFPIHNAKSIIIGFGGRALSDEDKPKYLNSSQSSIFDKSLELYGLDLARKHSKKIDYLLVVEGYMDVVALHCAGLTSCVATLGTATTAQHIKTLSRNTQLIVFCFDGDKAGFNAGIKALKTILSLMTNNLSVKFLFLPDGEDPDSLIKKEGKDKFDARIAKAVPLSNFLFSHLKDNLDFSTIEGKTQFIHQASNLIKQVNYNIYKEQLIQGLALEVGQSMEMVQKTIDSFTIEAKTQNVADEYDNYYQVQDNLQESNNETNGPQFVLQNNAIIKNHISKIITLILNHPAIAKDEIKTRIKKISNSQINTQVLQHIIDIAAFDKVDTYQLIQSFKNQDKIYKRLWALTKGSLKMTESKSENELEDTLSSLERYVLNLKDRQGISNSNSYNSSEQEQIKKNISAKKLPKLKM